MGLSVFDVVPGQGFSLVNFLVTLGVKEDIENAVPTQQVVETKAEDKGAVLRAGASDNITGFVEKSKTRMLDRWLDALARVSRSELIYLFDSLLMRQQLNEYERLGRVSAMLQSRNLSHPRMLRRIERAGRHVDLRREDLMGRMSTIASKVFGHIVTVDHYWVGTFIWVGFGHYCGWSDEWQLYINSATSAFMVFIFAFLAYVQECHTDYIDRCLNSIFEVDSSVELKLRLLSGDGTPNQTVARWSGTLVVFAILIIVMIVWLTIGPLLSFNSNWWLIIGTYAGLVGLNDCFVLRNVQLQLSRYQDAALHQVHIEDIFLFDDISVRDPKTEDVQADSLSYRLSEWMDIVCSHVINVVLGVKWSTTGQLLCNIPPSIVESFFMMILIAGHNINDSPRRADLRNMYSKGAEGGWV
ncbi:hypothetical protein C8A03DRAFT_47803 [Achaetomium macrosporum]|uniref:Uncharacterized protein n=1 Tax=Achaetomium macrosporum TaxID=79813 RepID=A0AAN7C1P0_9PEZI|nr:hypothetical protein C8A03DRAFT_47803 [Achaetomium macrosporum]